ncbi:hypothetical protein [Spongiactinospora sp. TRM90649]|uniref:hypothetical protein n=1 Tax=Spongiactinospora sp. TRM90649 TaxID=3031114 RepID=UPI0023F808CA|nr:hypothetical protein [Spongiactinospora sp. TRM90649]MDF5756751.1 hypothetical protein [Spongiactinospora sp. TRM90649]
MDHYQVKPDQQTPDFVDGQGDEIMIVWWGVGSCPAPLHAVRADLAGELGQRPAVLAF